MCSCHRDGKSKHTDACRRAHEKYNHSAKGVLAEIGRRVRDLEKQTGVKA